MSTEQERPNEAFEQALEKLGAIVLQGGVALSSFREEILGNLDTRFASLVKSEAEIGVDPFGMDPETVRKAAIGAAALYKLYFRCESEGLHNIPDGPVILVANHAGQLPIDGVMIATALFLEGEPPRLARSMMDRWVPTIPFVSTFYSRLGVAVGTPENAELLLSRNAALLTFPEGMAGITKTVDKAYQLQEFGLGYVRLALSSGAPVVPVAVVGSEEQYPTLYSLERAGKWLGVPAVPIWAQMVIPVIGMLPLPVKYRLSFGKPLRFEGDPDDEDAVIRALSGRVETQLKQQLDELRTKRKSVFW